MENTKKSINIKFMAKCHEPSFYEDDNGKRFTIICGLENEELLADFDVGFADEYYYDELGEEIGAIKTDKHYECGEILKRLRELGYRAMPIIFCGGELTPCSDEVLWSYFLKKEDREILYSPSGEDLNKFIELYNMNNEKGFVRILTSNGKFSKVIPWAANASGITDEQNQGTDVELSSYAIEELNKLGIKAQNSYNKIEFVPKIDEIDEFCSKNGILHYPWDDSYFFTVNGKECRVCDYTKFFPSHNNYDFNCKKLPPDRLFYGKRGEYDVDIIAGRTRLVQIYNDLKAGYDLDRRGFRKNK